MRRRSIILLILLSAGPSGSLAAPGASSPEERASIRLRPEVALSATAHSRGPLYTDLDRVLDRVPWPRARWSVLAVSLDQGDTLYARDPYTPLTPASNVKLLTSAAALHYLGPGFRFQTFVLSDGPVEADGTLRGDLILYGTGDPAISDRFYESKTEALDGLAAELSRAGVRRVRGNVVGDATFFSDGLRPPGWDASDLNDWFAAPVSALSFNENVATLRIVAGAIPGILPTVETIPEGAPLKILNQSATVAARPWPPIMTDRSNPRDPLRIVGQMRAGGPDAWRVITVDDPALFAAEAFREALGRVGIEVLGVATGLSDRDRSSLSGKGLWAPGLRAEPRIRVLARHRSPPLRELLKVLNKQSHNLYAELILKAVGQVAEGDPTLNGGVRAVSRYAREMAGVEPRYFQLEDGSGLSPGNRASASTFVRVLEQAAGQPWADDLWNSLPEAGNRRELRRMYRTRAARNLRAKTGTLEHVSALTGVVQSRQGETILFSIVSNGVPRTALAKRIEDRIGSILADFDRGERRAQRQPGASDE